MITFNIGRLSDQGLRWQGREANDELAIRDAIAKPSAPFYSVSKYFVKNATHNCNGT